MSHLSSKEAHKMFLEKTLAESGKDNFISHLVELYMILKGNFNFMILIAKVSCCIICRLSHEHFSIRLHILCNVFTLPGYIRYGFLLGARFTLFLRTDCQLLIFIPFLFALVIIIHFQVPPATLVVFFFHVFMPECQ